MKRISGSIILVGSAIAFSSACSMRLERVGPGVKTDRSDTAVEVRYPRAP
jgi:hypothetical protein